MTYIELLQHRSVDGSPELHPWCHVRIDCVFVDCAGADKTDRPWSQSDDAIKKKGGGGEAYILGVYDRMY